MGVACGMYGETRVACRILEENLTARDHLDNLGIRGLLEKYPTFGREKETGLLGALDT